MRIRRREISRSVKPRGRPRYPSSPALPPRDLRTHDGHLIPPLTVHAAEGAGAAAVDAPPAATSMAALLTRHVLRDGELVILLLKPSAWFIVFASLRFSAVVLLLMGAVFIFDLHQRFEMFNTLSVIQSGLFLIGARVMWSLLQWTSRLYVLTDLRIVAISGVFNVSIFDCALRKVARTRLLMSARDRIVRVGSIEIIPFDEEAPEGLWQTIARPRQVHEQVVATINRAKQGCSM